MLHEKTKKYCKIKKPCEFKYRYTFKHHDTKKIIGYIVCRWEGLCNQQSFEKVKA